MSNIVETANVLSLLKISRRSSDSKYMTLQKHYNAMSLAVLQKP